uniref:Uncharacterized protein n=1 Tax=Panagrolaimus davidi TaxID=227884 RepID=A0A914QV53_9BILA
MAKFLLILFFVCIIVGAAFGKEDLSEEVHANKNPATKEERMAQADKVLGITKKEKRDNTVGNRHFAKFGSINPIDKRFFRVFGY